MYCIVQIYSCIYTVHQIITVLSNLTYKIIYYYKGEVRIALKNIPAAVCRVRLIPNDVTCILCYNAAPYFMLMG